MAKTSSRFGLNLFFQFLLNVLLAGLSQRLGFHEILDTASIVMFSIFIFGLIYAIVRAFGVRSKDLEAFYQNFPIGFLSGNTQTKGLAKHGKNKTKQTGFQWKNLFTFKYLRYVGALLMITAISSLFLQIDWNLKEKIILALTIGGIMLVGAEVLMRRNLNNAASISSTFSFSSVLFGIGLCAEYFGGTSDWYSNIHLWITLQALVTACMSPILTRYASKLQAYFFFSIAYILPFAIHSVHPNLNLDALTLEYVLPSLAIISGTALLHTFLKKDPGLLSLNIFMVDVVLWSVTPLQGINIFYALIGIFLIHLTAAVAFSNQKVKDKTSLQTLHVILLHILVLWHVTSSTATVSLPYKLSDHIGYFFMGFAVLTLFGYLKAQGNKENPLAKTLSDASLITSGIAFFMEIKNQWSAVFFLAYACTVLAFGLYQKSLRSILYGFIFLTVSIIELYLVSPEIFNTISGSVAILCLGGLIIALSYKFETVKDYFEKVKF